MKIKLSPLGFPNFHAAAPRWCLLALWLGLAALAAAAGTPLPNFDRRLDAVPPVAAAADPAKSAATQRLQSRVGQLSVDLDPLLGTPKFIASTAEFLTGPNGAGGAVSDATANLFPADEPKRGIKTFLTEHQALFGFGPEALAAAKVNRDYISTPGGFSTTVWQQHVDDIAVFEAVFKAHLTKNGELINVSSQFVPDLQTAAGKIAARATLEAAPPISAEQAIILAAQNIGDVLTTNQLTAQDTPQGSEQVQHFRGSPVLNNTSARLAWLPVDAGTLRLCWNANVESRARGELYQILVDAVTGEIWLRQCLTEYISPITMSVWTNDSPTPMMPTLGSMTSYQPPQVPRSLVTFAALDTNASPAGWINDGNNTTVGNNVDAHLDWDNNNIADPGSQPAGSPNRVFDFPLDLTQPPYISSNAVVVSLFYWNNFAHDRFYEYGFTEAAGNFQANRFGRGGTNNNPVQADGQDSYALAATNTTRNNANFATPTDGSSPRMQMYIFNWPSPNRDGDLDATMMLHEYTHGVSSRLVGGGSVGITALQSSEMGEGWSDFCALSLLSSPTNDPDANQGMFAYLGYNFVGMTSNYFFGLRRYPYSVNTNVNPLTYKDIDTNQLSAHVGVPISPWLGYSPANANEVHNAGEVWCVALWEARSRMCHKYGNAAGNQMMLQLVIDGMKHGPANPLFLQARDAILQADLVDYGGADLDLLWASFAKRGMGYYASSPNNNTTTGVGESFVTPLDTNAPIISVISPANNAALNLLTNISGTAYDGGSGLQGNQIHFTLNHNGNFWSGTYWTNTATTDPSILLTANVVNGVWTFTGVPTGGDQSQGNYYVSASARDNAGNNSQAQSGVTSTSFIISTTPPNVAITSPLDGTTITNQPGGNWFQGTASGNLGIQIGMSLFIRRNSDSLYWTGSGWGDVTNGFISNTYNTNTHVWQGTGTLPVPGSSLGNGDYHFIAIATDVAGNKQQVDSVVSVDFHPVYVFTAGSYYDTNAFNDNMNWSNPANWDVGSVPTSDARVVINGYSPDNTGLGSLKLYRLDLSGGNLITSGMLITNLYVSGGVLLGGAIGVPANGVFNWSGGTLTGTYNVPASATFNISGSNDKTLAQNTDLTFAGSGSWTGSGNINAAFSSVITNNGTFTVQNDSSFLNNANGYGGSLPLPLFVNNGSLIKTNSSNITVFDVNYGGVAFNNNGSVNVQSGNLALGGGGISPNTSFTVVAGSVVDFYGGVFFFNGNLVLQGAGTNRVSGATVTFNRTTNTLSGGNTFAIASGTVAGTNTFTGAGAVNWSGGTVSAALNLQSGVALNISGAATKTLGPSGTAASIVSAGPATWTDAGQILCSFASVFENDGTFTARNDSAFINNADGYGGPLPVPLFVNKGTLVKTNSTGQSLFDLNYGGVAFNNSGSVLVQSGNLALGGGGAFTNGFFTTATGAILDFTNGAFFLNGIQTWQGAGTNRISGATVNFNRSTNALSGGNTFALATGTVAGTNTFTGPGIMSWSGGTVSAALNLQSGIALNISGAANKTLGPSGAAPSIVSAGPVTWTDAGQILCSFASVFENDGTFTVRNDSTFINNADGYGGPLPVPLFVNKGTFVKTNSPGLTLFDLNYYGVAFNNSGSVQVQSGNLALGGGGTFTNGAFTTGAGAILDFTNGLFFLNGTQTLQGTGTNRVSGATVTFNRGTNSLSGGSTFAIASGTVVGTNTFTGAGTMNWSGGTISAALNLQSGIALNISGAANKTLGPSGAAPSIVSAGPATWTDAGQILCSFASVFENDGTFTVRNDSAFINNADGYGGPLPVPLFVNKGTFVKTNSPGLTLYDLNYGGVAFNNSGSVQVQSGNLALGGGGAFTNGALTTSPTAMLDFTNGAFLLNGTQTWQGAGTNRVSGATVTFNHTTAALSGGNTFALATGTVAGTNTFTGTGILSWSGGTISAALNLQSGIALIISGAANKTLGPSSVAPTIVSAGPATWTGAGQILCSFASVFENDGTFTVLNDSAFINNADGYGGPLPVPLFVNKGIFFKTSTTGITYFDVNYGGVTFNNQGTVQLPTGTLALNGYYSTSPASQLKIAIGGPNAGTQFGTEFFGSAATFDGTLAVSLVNGFVPTNGQSFALASYPSRTGQFAATQLPALPVTSKWQVTYNPTTLLLQVVPSTAFQSVWLTNGNFAFTFSGQTGSRCLVEVSTNLSNWTPFLTNTPFNGLLRYVDPEAPLLPKRFYRATIFP